MTPTPTPQGISALLRKAGFTRSETHRKGLERGVVCTEGFHVTASTTEPGVLVRYWKRPDADSNLAANRAMLVRYAEALSGYEVEMRRHELIVTAKPSSPLAAKEG